MWTSLLFLGALAAQDSSPQPVSVHQAAADPAIEAEALLRHVHVLAADAMKGRMTGSPETRTAAEYIAAVLQKAGVAAAGDDGTWYQRVPLVELHYDEAPQLTVEETDGTTWTAAHGSDFQLRVRGLPDEARRLPLGTTAPDEDEAGGVALFVPGNRSAYRAWLDQQGLGSGDALGLLVLEGTSRERPARGMRGGGLTVVPAGADPGDQVIANARLLAALEEGRIAALTLHTNARAEDRSCQNVLGVIEGVGTEAAPELAEQAIVLTAHYDHIGHREADAEEGAEADPEADTVFNGADDDASGVAALLEVAEALGAAPAPARTVVFLLVTGEERGLLGTELYLDRPLVPLERTLYNLNVEMVGRPDPLMPGPGELWLTGWDETTLGPSLEGEGQPVHPDPRPEQNFYQRSDNIAFVRRGVMGQTLSSFGMHTDYHRATDEPDTLDYEHMRQATENILEVVRALAIQGLSVDWAKEQDR